MLSLIFVCGDMFDDLNIVEMGLCLVNRNPFVQIDAREFYLPCGSHEAGSCTA